MTAISALSTGTTATHRMAPPAGPPRPPRDGQDPMAAVADRLGLSRDELRSQLQDGQSLDDIATTQGVSHDDLLTAIKAGLPADAATGTDATATQDSAKLDRLSQLLELDSDEVTSRASSATDLVKLLQDKGVDLTALRSVLSNGDLLDVAA